MHGNDVLQSITIDCNENDRVLIWRIKEKFYLLCVVDPTVPQMSYTEGIEATLDMIEQSKISSPNSVMPLLMCSCVMCHFISCNGP